MMATNRPRFTATPDQTEPGRKVLCRIVDWDGGSENASVEGGNHRVLIDGLTPREAVVGAHELDMMVRTLPKGLPADMLDDLVAFQFPDKARPGSTLCAKETRHPESRVTSLCRLPKGHEGRCEP